MPTMPVPDAWSYGGKIDATAVDYNPVDEVRYLAQDIDPMVRLLADTEVAYQIVQWIGTYTVSGTGGVAGEWTGGAYDHPLMAAHGCALRIAAKFAGIPQISADAVAVNIGDLQERYATLAIALKQEYERISQTGADVDLANLMVADGLDPSIRPTTFGIGMNDNPAAGQQDYGSLTDWPAFTGDVAVP